MSFVNSETGAYIEEVAVSMSRLINNSWSVVASKTSDITGRVQFIYTPLMQYRFTAVHPDYNSKTFTLDPVLFETYTVQMTEIITIDEEVDFSKVSIYFEPKIFYNNQVNNLTFYIISPEGVLENYGYNVTFPSGSVADSGVNSIGENFITNINISNAGITDTVDILIYYKSSLNSEVKSFTYKYSILKAGSLFGTAISNAENPYDLALFDRIFIMVMVTLIICGFAYAFGGQIISLLTGIMIMGYFGYIKFVPSWSIIVSVIVLFVLAAWGSNR